MESTHSDSDDTAFVPASASPAPVARKRRGSVGDMIRRLDQKKQRITSPKHQEKVSTEADFLEEIRTMMVVCVQEGNDKLWKKVESKITSYEERMDRLEGEIFARDQRIDQLESQLRACHDSLERHEELLDDIERHSRASNLVLSSQRFGQRREGEDIVGMAVKVINDNYKDVQVTRHDFSVVHRLSKENTVICAFLNKGLRNQLYEGRLNLRFQADFANRLFVTENLTRAKSQIFNRLLQMKRGGLIWTVFSKGGIPCYKPSKTAAPIRVHTMQQFIAVERDLGTARPGTGRSPAAPPLPLPPPPGRASQLAHARTRRGGTPPGGREGDAGPAAAVSAGMHGQSGAASPMATAAGADAVVELPLAGGSVEPAVSVAMELVPADEAGDVPRPPRIGDPPAAESAPVPAGAVGAVGGRPAAPPAAGAAAVDSPAAPAEPAGDVGGGPLAGDA